MQNVKVDRDKYVGGSDIPIIMNISPFKTRWELLQEEAGLIKNEFTGNQYTEYGFSTTIIYMKYTKRKKGKLAVYERPENFDETFDESRLTIYDIDIKDYKDLLEEIDLAVDDFRNDLRRIKENPFLTEADLEPKDLIEIAKKLEEIETKLSGYDEIVKKRDDLKTQLKDKLDEIGKKQFKTSNYKFTRVADGKDTIIEIFDEDKFKEINEKLYKEYSHEEVSIIFDLDKFKEEHEKEAKKYITTSVKKGKAGYLKMIGIVGECNEWRY